MTMRHLRAVGKMSGVTNRRDYCLSPNWGATPASGSMPLDLIWRKLVELVV